MPRLSRERNFVRLAPNQYTRNWYFETDRTDLIDAVRARVKYFYLVVGAQRTRWVGYIQLRTSTRFTVLNAVGEKQIQWFPAELTAARNIRYCKRCIFGAVEEGKPFCLNEVQPSIARIVYDALKQGCDSDTVDAMLPGAHYHRKRMEKMPQSMKGDRRSKTVVTWIWGRNASKKNALAVREAGKEAYRVHSMRRSDLQWFADYQGEEHVIWNKVTISRAPYALLAMLAGWEPVTIEIPGTFVDFRATRLWVIADQPPSAYDTKHQRAGMRALEDSVEKVVYVARDGKVTVEKDDTSTESKEGLTREWLANAMAPLFESQRDLQDFIEAMCPV